MGRHEVYPKQNKAFPPPFQFNLHRVVFTQGFHSIQDIMVPWIMNFWGHEPRVPWGIHVCRILIKHSYLKPQCVPDTYGLLKSIEKLRIHMVTLRENFV